MHTHKHASSIPTRERELPRTPPRKVVTLTDSLHQTPGKAETPRKEHQRFVLTDPIAFRYLEDDPSTTVLERARKLPGYECYVVEQWAVSRENPTFIITTYTGDPKHVVQADVLGVPTDEKTWSQRLRVFFRALNQHHARREITPLGTLIVTNLSGFPSTLTVIPVPSGDVRNHRADFFVNENLKRLGCLGRLGLTLGSAPSSAVAKFNQIYHTSEKNDVRESIVELVRLIQVALSLFNKLEIDYADGLLCDMTERAISRWWNDVGAQHYGIEPHDGLLGPTTVASILGLLMGVRNRLRSCGVTAPKDPFDLEGMKRSIASFQKQQRLDKPRRLDEETLSLLLKVTTKAATGDGWAVPRAVKSTVAELSGRGGDMLNEAVRKRDRAGIAEIETTDYDHFLQLAYGPHAKWLWHGKALKKTGGLGQPLSDHTATLHKESARLNRGDSDPKTPVVDSEQSDFEDHKMGIRKRATDLRHEARTGLSKIKDAVHLRHRHQASPNHKDMDSHSHPHASLEQLTRSDYSSPGSPLNGPISPISPPLDSRPAFSFATEPVQPRSDRAYQSRDHSPHDRQLLTLVVPPDDNGDDVLAETRNTRTAKDMRVTTSSADKVAVTDFGQHLLGPPLDFSIELPAGIEATDEVGLALRRTYSDSNGLATKAALERPTLFPKHLSYTLAEESILPWTGLDDDALDSSILDDTVFSGVERFKAEKNKHLYATIQHLQSIASTWTDKQVAVLSELVDRTGHDLHTTEEAYRPRADTVLSLTTTIDLLLRNERVGLEEGKKELETLAARLTYEIDGLKGRIEDVDQVIDDFETSVRRVEDRVAELEKADHQQRGWDCIVS